MTTPRKIVAGVTVLAVAAAGVGVAVVATNDTTATAEPMNCEEWGVQLTSGECFAAGTIRYISLPNLQGAAQFCNWKKANPGEWSRLKNYSETEAFPQNIITWMGAHILNDLQAYFVTGAPTFIIAPNTAPNVCKTPLPPPVVGSVTPGQTDATVTIG